MNKEQLQQYISDLYEESVKQSNAMREIKEYYENINTDKCFKEKLIELLKEEEGERLTDFMIADLAQYLINSLTTYIEIKNTYS